MCVVVEMSVLMVDRELLLTLGVVIMMLLSVWMVVVEMELTVGVVVEVVRQLLSLGGVEVLVTKQLLSLDMLVSTLLLTVRVVVMKVL